MLGEVKLCETMAVYDGSVYQPHVHVFLRNSPLTLHLTVIHFSSAKKFAEIKGKAGKGQDSKKDKPKQEKKQQQKPKKEEEEDDDDDDPDLPVEPKKDPFAEIPKG